MGESSSGVRSEPTSMGPKLGRPTMKQLTFDLSLVDTYMELNNFRLEVNNSKHTIQIKQKIYQLLITD